MSQPPKRLSTIRQCRKVHQKPMKQDARSARAPAIRRRSARNGDASGPALFSGRHSLASLCAVVCTQIAVLQLRVLWCTLRVRTAGGGPASGHPPRPPTCGGACDRSPPTPRGLRQVTQGGLHNPAHQPHGEPKPPCAAGGAVRAKPPPRQSQRSALRERRATVTRRAALRSLSAFGGMRHSAFCAMASST